MSQLTLLNDGVTPLTMNHSIVCLLRMKATLDTTIVQVFKTNVQTPWQAEMLCDMVHQQFPKSQVNFDLDDCDKIFRVASASNMDAEIISFLNVHGFTCEELPD